EFFIFIYSDFLACYIMRNGMFLKIPKNISIFAEDVFQVYSAWNELESCYYKNFFADRIERIVDWGTISDILAPMELGVFFGVFGSMR
ncbi:hypothetical protein ACJX0J_016641, partial [Zea mays]